MTATPAYQRLVARILPDEGMLVRVLTAAAFSLVTAGATFAQQPQTHPVHITKGVQVILPDTVFITHSDTILHLTANEARTLKIKKNPYRSSTRFYDSLQSRAESNKVTSDIFDLVIKKEVLGRKTREVSAIIRSEEVFRKYTGYKIGSISFKRVDLLEGSVVDTLKHATTKVGKLVSNIHTDTRIIVLRQNLLFHEGDTVDPYVLADNERILRQFKTLRDVRIYLTPSESTPHEVDVVVVTQDVASIGISGDYRSPQNYRIDLYDVNILGYAKQLQLSYFRNAYKKPSNGYEITIRDQNLFHNFIQGEIQYTENYLRRRSRFSFGRDFLTPTMKFAGGIEWFRTHEQFLFEAYDTLETPYTQNALDIWMGHSFRWQERTNLIVTARMDHQTFVERPFVASDSNSYFFNRNLILSAITLIKRNYLKSLRIRGFGRTEDIPVGGAIGVQAGKEFNEFVDRTYLELNLTGGQYFERLGYLNVSVVVGSFFRHRQAEDGLIKLGAIYFSDLVKGRRSQIRQFAYSTYTLGIDRKVDKTVGLDGEWVNKNGFGPLGDERLTLGFETVYFLPWYLYGFQFAAYHTVDLNLLTFTGNLFSKESFFPALKIGVRFSNEYLVLPRFSFELGYYGKNPHFASGWEFKVATTLPDLFGTTQLFKPRVPSFD